MSLVPGSGYYGVIVFVLFFDKAIAFIFKKSVSGQIDF